MALFKRRDRSEDADVEVDADGTAPDGAAAAEPTGSAPASGPWDAADAPTGDGVHRIDLGGMRVPVPPGTEVRVDVNKDTVVAATLAREGSALQVNVFAAPRSEGIWDEVREEIAASLGRSGGQAETSEGPLGTELVATVPTQQPSGDVLMAPARFVGVDGPRWFLRALLTGPAARDEAAAAPLLAALRDVVVVRGTDPMAVRDPIPLRLPPDAQKASDAAQAAQAGDPLALQERGPEITETR